MGVRHLYWLARNAECEATGLGREAMTPFKAPILSLSAALLPPAAQHAWSWAVVFSLGLGCEFSWTFPLSLQFDAYPGSIHTLGLFPFSGIAPLPPTLVRFQEPGQALGLLWGGLISVIEAM